MGLCEMKKEGFKYLCKIDKNRRLYNGAWYHKSVLPKPLEDEIIFEEFPQKGQPNEGNGVSCNDFIFINNELVYSPINSDNQTEYTVIDYGSEIEYK